MADPVPDAVQQPGLINQAQAGLRAGGSRVLPKGASQADIDNAGRIPAATSAEKPARAPKEGK